MLLLSSCHLHTLQQKPETGQDVPFQLKLYHAEVKYAAWNRLETKPMVGQR